MNRHQIVIEVDTNHVPDDDVHTAYLLMLHLADTAEDRGWVLTDAFVREVTEDQ